MWINCVWHHWRHDAACMNKLLECKWDTQRFQWLQKTCEVLLLHIYDDFDGLHSTRFQCIEKISVNILPNISFCPTEDRGWLMVQNIMSVLFLSAIFFWKHLFLRVQVVKVSQCHFCKTFLSRLFNFLLSINTSSSQHNSLGSFSFAR